MIACVDIDGTLTRFPDQLRAVCTALRQAGWRVVLLTGCRGPGPYDVPAMTDQRRRQVEPFGCPYDEIQICAAETHEGVSAAKAEYLFAIGATLFIDDDPLYVADARRLSPGTLSLKVGAE